MIAQREAEQREIEARYTGGNTGANTAYTAGDRDVMSAADRILAGR